MGAWLAEQIVRAIEPEDPEERERYWRRGGFFTAPFRWLRDLLRDPEDDARDARAVALVAWLQENTRRRKLGLPPVPSPAHRLSPPAEQRLEGEAGGPPAEPPAERG